MEPGQQYDVFYKDDSQTRHKVLIFLKVEEGLISFHNDRNNKIEIIPVGNIIRIQGDMDNEKGQHS